MRHYYYLSAGGVKITIESDEPQEAFEHAFLSQFPVHVDFAVQGFEKTNAKAYVETVKREDRL